MSGLVWTTVVTLASPVGDVQKPKTGRKCGPAQLSMNGWLYAQPVGSAPRRLVA